MTDRLTKQMIFDNLEEIGKKFNKNYIQTLQKYKNISFKKILM